MNQADEEIIDEWRETTDIPIRYIAKLLDLCRRVRAAERARIAMAIEPLRELARVRANGTPGPWLCDEPDNWLGLSTRVCTSKYEPIAQVQLSGWPKRIAKRNGPFIALAGSTDFAAILKQLEEPQ